MEILQITDFREILGAYERGEIPYSKMVKAFNDRIYLNITKEHKDNDLANQLDTILLSIHLKEFLMLVQKQIPNHRTKNINVDLAIAAYLYSISNKHKFEKPNIK